MYLLIIFLPFLSAFFSGFFGFFIGRKGSAIISTASLFVSMLLSYFIAFEILLGQNSCYIQLFSWISILNVSWSFLFDGLTSAMLCVVLTISFLVHLYSIEYMKEDPHLSRFMAYLSLFTFFMVMLVTSANYLQLFLGWEGVGLCSYLLISFWFTRLQANKAALKAIIVNKIGDFGIVAFLIAVYFLVHSFDFGVIFPVLPYFVDKEVYFDFLFFGFSVKYVSFLAFLLFLAAMGKSAQIFLHTWLPDAMEGPTPVSALIHAATMVTAGVFVIIRSSPIFELSDSVLTVMTIVGGVTALFAASCGMFQYDLKKVIAYSTCSQLGYMVFACGLSSYQISLFHLTNHAFFKALLFLSAGAIIHGMNNEQDMRRMGGLINLMPFSYTMFIIGSLALSGFPFLSGYYSKDAIIEIAAASFTISGNFVFWLGSLSAFLTSFYSFRLIYLTFFSVTNSPRPIIQNAHDAPLLMAIPMGILALGSIFLGYLTKELFIGVGCATFSNCIFVSFEHSHGMEAEFLPLYIKLIPLGLSLFGILLVFVLYFFCESLFFKLKLTRFGNTLFFFFIKKWYFDNIYNAFIVKKLLHIGHHISYRLIDQGLIEFFGPTGISRLFTAISTYINNLSTGTLYHYAFIMFAGVFNIFVYVLVTVVLGFDFSLFFNYKFIFLLLVLLFIPDKEK